MPSDTMISKPWTSPDVQNYQEYHPNHDFSVIDVLPGDLLRDGLYPYDFENQHDSYGILETSRKYNIVAFAVGLGYIAAVFLGQHFMRNREAVDTRRAVTFWNLFMAVFSFVGACRTVPHLLLSGGMFGTDYLFCRWPPLAYLNGPAGVWTFLFVVSKYFELIDTAFLIVNKKSVNFLHWWRHATFLMYFSDAHAHAQPAVFILVTLNYCVNAFLYYHHYLVSIGQATHFYRPTATTHLWQAIAGFGIMAYQKYKLETCETCNGSTENSNFGAFVYASQALFLARFAVSRYRFTNDSL